MSKYVTRMKGVLTTLNTTANQIHKEIDYNNQNFLPDVAADANTNLQAKLNQAADSARDQIDAIREEAKAAVRKWAEPSGTEIDAADLALLKGEFWISIKDVHNLLVKHQGNGTMVNAIAKYAKEHDIVLAYIPNAADKLHAYDSFAKSAHDMIAEITNAIGLGDTNLPLAMWAEPGNISQRMEDALYGIKEYEEPSAVQPKANFEFNFAPKGQAWIGR